MATPTQRVALLRAIHVSRRLLGAHPRCSVRRHQPLASEASFMPGCPISLYDDRLTITTSLDPPPPPPALVQPHLESLRKYTYGKHIVAKVENMLAQQAQQEAAEAAAAAAAAASEGQQPALALQVPAAAGAEGHPVGV